MTTTPKARLSKETFDVAVIGGGLSGLSISASLHQAGLKVALLDSGDILGGTTRVVQTPNGFKHNSGLRFLSDSPLAHQGLEFLASVLNSEIQTRTEEVPPVTFQDQQLRPFVGFGEMSPAYVEELSYFFAAHRLHADPSIFDWTKLLADKAPHNRFLRSWITKLGVENGQVTHAIVNGDKAIHAQHFVFTGRMKDLMQLLPEDAIPQRTRQKMAKGPHWTALCLDIVHNDQVTDSPAIHVLRGTPQDEMNPCIGQFLPAQEEGRQTSQWLTFLDEEATEDSEIVAGALKRIKRQIKQAYPQAIESIKQERIVVHSDFSSAVDLKLNANQSWPGLSNLWIGSGSSHANQKNLIGSLLQAALVTESLKQELSETENTSQGPQIFSENSPEA